MTVRIKLDTKGLEESLEDIARLGEDVNLAAAKALDAGGGILLNGMRRRVPKLTRNLDRHLECTKPMQEGNYISVTVGLARGVDRDTARYGTAQEYGTSSMAAQPYVRPTIDSDMGAARRAMVEVLQEEIGKS